ncbi:hypothetical protein D3C78_851060 [compost metagenome]
MGVTQAVGDQRRVRIDRQGQAVIPLRLREFVTQVGQDAQPVVHAQRRLGVHPQGRQLARHGRLPLGETLLVQAQRTVEGLRRLGVAAHADQQRPQLAQGFEIVRLRLEHLAQGQLGQALVAPLAVDTPDPDQRFVTLGIELADTQVLVQRLIAVPRRIGRGGHAQGLLRRFGTFLHLIEHRATAVVEVAAAVARFFPRALAACQSGSKRCQKCDPAHITISQRP